MKSVNCNLTGIETEVVSVFFSQRFDAGGVKVVTVINVIEVKVVSVCLLRSNKVIFYKSIIKLIGIIENNIETTVSRVPLRYIP